ncbi:MAG: PHP domain-containing protein [Clostridia bacterium]|nr:PHP domain-containing protein [Clostridia bacterium]
MLADIHLHSTASDGMDTPARIAFLAREAGIGLISLTDHDTTGGVRECSEACRGYGIRFLPGIEISAGEGGNIHVLGYNIDPSRLQLELDRIRDDRTERMEKMVSLLKKAGMEVSMEDVRSIAGSAPLCRPHLALALVRKGYVLSVKEAFDRYIGAGRPFLVDRRRFSFAQAADLIHASGGLAVIAHPLLIKVERRMLTQYLSSLIDMGADGIEAWHSSHTLSDALELDAFARRRSMLVTGGSDYHGAMGAIRIGDGQRGRTRMDEDIRDLLSRAGIL